MVRFDLLDSPAAAAFDALTAEALPAIVDTEPGTLVYAVHRVEDEPLSRVFYEVYADRDAHQAHEANPPTRRFLDQMQQHLRSVRAEFLETPHGKGLALSV
ncbi:MAG: antibiotic biosynthesis monooxygenase [Propionibacteriaceae bacterium]